MVFYCVMYLYGAGDGNRTRMAKSRGILSPLRIPVPPHQHIKIFITICYNIIYYIIVAYDIVCCHVVNGRAGRI